MAHQRFCGSRWSEFIPRKRVSFPLDSGPFLCPETPCKSWRTKTRLSCMEYCSHICNISQYLSPCTSLGPTRRWNLWGWCELLLRNVLPCWDRYVRTISSCDTAFSQYQYHSLVISGLGYLLYIHILPALGGYAIRQLVQRLDDGAITNKLVRVPNAELAKWDSIYDEHGEVILRRNEVPDPNHAWILMTTDDLTTLNRIYNISSMSILKKKLARQCISKAIIRSCWMHSEDELKDMLLWWYLA